MVGDNVAFWDEVWGEIGHGEGDSSLLASEVSELKPGDVLEFGCGRGENAVWLAKQGWRVTAVDFSRNAIRAGKRMAAVEGVEVDFVVADASIYQPEGRYDLVMSFYIHLPPAQRAAMLSNSVDALKPGGALLFVSHDRSAPPSGWSADDMLTLTSPDEVVSELPTMQIECALVVEHEGGAHAEQRHGAHKYKMNSTFIRATKE